MIDYDEFKKMMMSFHDHFQEHDEQEQQSILDMSLISSIGQGLESLNKDKAKNKVLNLSKFHNDKAKINDSKNSFDRQESIGESEDFSRYKNYKPADENV